MSDLIESLEREATDKALAIEDDERREFVLELLETTRKWAYYLAGRREGKIEPLPYRHLKLIDGKPESLPEPAQPEVNGEKKSPRQEFRERRKDLHLSQEELSFKIGCAPDCISKYERGLNGIGEALVLKARAIMGLNGTQNERRS